VGEAGGLRNLYFLSFELLIYLLFGLSLLHAWQKGKASGSSLAIIWQLLAGVLFGLLLEWATIQQLQAYEYGRFLLMLGSVPVPIGVAWGTIIYASRLFSDSTSLPEWARPLLDGLLALNIDLSMDAIAIRLGFWQWGLPLDAQFFGVPYANFWAWFWVVFFFSAGLRLLSRLKQPVGMVLAPLGAILVGVVGVLATNRLIVNISEDFNFYVTTIILTLSAAIGVVLVLRPRLRGRPANLAAWVPLAFHAYYLIAGALAGIFASLPALLAISLVMALISMMFHFKLFKESVG
jgi:hypothetical protein